MGSSKATTVEEYLDGLPDDRRATVSKVRSVVRKNLPGGYEESVGYGMITWQIPLSDYPETYSGQPLCYIALASQKNYCSLYLMGANADAVQRKTLREGFEAAGKKLDMGKSCVRFRTPDDLPLDVIGEVVSGMPPSRLIELVEDAHAGKKKKGAGTTRR